MLRWAAACCLVAQIAHAQSAASDGGDIDYSDYHDEEPAQTRRLHDHVFLVPILQLNGFVTTHVGIREGVIVVDIPDLPVADLGTTDVSLVGFQQNIDLGFRIVEWLGLSGQAHVLAYTGTDRESILINGASVNYTLEGGAIARLWKNDKLGSQLSFRANGSFGKGQELPLLALVQAVVDSPVASVRSIVRGGLSELVIVPTSSTAVNGGLYGAQYLNRFLALQLSALFQYSWETREPVDPRIDERYDQDSTVWQTNLGAALELTFEPLHVPLSLQAEYLLVLGDRDSDDDRALDHDVGSSSFGFGIYYVGRPNLQLGIGSVATLSAEVRRGVGRNGDAGDSGEPTLGYTDLILRYIW